jgi:uncharacterized protein (UPF0335 family)
MGKATTVDLDLGDTLSTAPASSGDKLRGFIDNVRGLRSEVKELNGDIAAVYERAKESGFDVKAIKALIKRLESDPGELAELEARVADYEAIYQQHELPLGASA